MLRISSTLLDCTTGRSAGFSPLRTRRARRLPPRRTKAAYIYEQTRNIEVIRELLGQKSVSATSANPTSAKRRLWRLRASMTFDQCLRARCVCPIAMADESCIPPLNGTVRLRPAALFLAWPPQIRETPQARSTPRPHSSAGVFGCGPCATNGAGLGLDDPGATGLLAEQRRRVFAVLPADRDTTCSKVVSIAVEQLGRLGTRITSDTDQWTQ
jgi:hypothetical protein